METLFTKIANGQIPSTKLYEDEKCFVIMDINPVKKGHSLVISRQPYPNMASCPDDVLTHMLLIAKKVEAKQREVLCRWRDAGTGCKALPELRSKYGALPQLRF